MLCGRMLRICYHQLHPDPEKIIGLKSTTKSSLSEIKNLPDSETPFIRTTAASPMNHTKDVDLFVKNIYQFQNANPII